MDALELDPGYRERRARYRKTIAARIAALMANRTPNTEHRTPTPRQLRLLEAALRASAWQRPPPGELSGGARWSWGDARLAGPAIERDPDAPPSHRFTLDDWKEALG